MRLVGLAAGFEHGRSFEEINLAFGVEIVAVERSHAVTGIANLGSFVRGPDPWPCARNAVNLETACALQHFNLAFALRLSAHVVVDGEQTAKLRVTVVLDDVLGHAAI